jgi:ABC-type dipeptide/oligopeptide/nickel transport system permease component
VLGAILKPSTVATIIHWGLIIYGVIIVIGNIPGLVSGIANVHKAAGMFDLVCSVLGIALGVAMIFYQGTVLVALVAAYLIVFPLVRVLMAEQKLEQLKREALRMILGVVLLVFVPSLVGAAFTLVHLLLVISGWTVIALSTIFGVIEIIRIATAKEIKAPASGHIYVDFEEKQD